VSVHSKTQEALVLLKSASLALLAAASISVVCVQANQQEGSAIRLMRQLYVQDQRDRGVLLSDAGDALPAAVASNPPVSLPDAELNKNDAARRNKVRELLRAGQVTTAQDFHDAAFIFQHGEMPEDYLFAHILAVEAVVKGDSRSKWISAATLDRYLQAIGQAQVFGTQYSDRDFAFVIRHKDNPAAMKAHRHEDGMTQQPYDDALMPDVLRLDFCVPSRAQQKVNLKEFEAGRYPSGILPPGCTR
jgi:hypothetical protein